MYIYVCEENNSYYFTVTENAHSEQFPVSFEPEENVWYWALLSEGHSYDSLYRGPSRRELMGVFQTEEEALSIQDELAEMVSTRWKWNNSAVKYDKTNPKPPPAMKLQKDGVTYDLERYTSWGDMFEGLHVVPIRAKPLSRTVTVDYGGNISKSV